MYHNNIVKISEKKKKKKKKKKEKKDEQEEQEERVESLPPSYLLYRFRHSIYCG